MGKLRMAFAVFVVLAISVSSLYAAEGEGFIQKIKKRLSPKPKPVTKSVSSKAKPSAAFKKTDIKASDVKAILDSEETIISFIPDLKKASDKDGNAYYTYQGARLEDLDKEKLKTVYSNVAREKSRIQSDRVRRQLETVRQAQTAGQQKLPPALPPSVNIPKIPKPYTAPAPQRIPSTPKIPPAPPIKK
jgi:hypothetical protein